MAVDYIPVMGDYKTLQPFRYWCQKVLPLVYDDSLSYYELLCKVVNYLNETMEDVDTLHDDVEALLQAYVQLQTWVNNYFDNLDIQSEINQKLDAMAVDGTLSELVSPLIPDIITDWMDEHITPTTPVIDDSLTVSGAGADAKVTGDYIREINSTIEEITEVTDNLLNGVDGGWVGNGMRYYVFDEALPAGTYTLMLKAHSDNDYPVRTVISRLETFSRIAFVDVQQDTLTKYVFNSSEAIKSLWITAGRNSSEYANANLTIDIAYFHAGDVDQIPYPHYSATDYIARSYNALLSTNNTEDRTVEIETLLNKHGYCELGKGVFYVGGISMPVGSTIKGQGDCTKIILNSDVTGNAINMEDGCSVKDVTILGGLTDITLDGNVVGTADVESYSNLWLEGNVTTDSAGFSHIVLTNPIPAGCYRLSAYENRASGEGMGYIAFSTDPNASISSGNIVGRLDFNPNENYSGFVVITETAYSVRISSAQVANSGIVSTWSNIKVTKVGARNGIAWEGTAKLFGMITNCRIKRFDCAGIYASDTTQLTDHNLVIDNCYVNNCNVGIYIRKNSEFHRINTCTLSGNYYGYLCRGGNNNLANSGLDGNVINVQIDADEGTNTGHGTISSCSLNHANNNTGYSLIIKTTGRMLVTGCNFYYGATLLESTNGNVIDGCGYGSTADWIIKDSNCNIFANCMVRHWGGSDTNVNITNARNTKILNCFSRDGVAYDS